MNSMLLRLMRVGDKDLMLFLHTSRPPSQADWDETMALMETYARKGDVRRLRILAITDGGGPDADMRGQASAFFKAQNHSVRTAAIMTSIMARGIVAAVSFFNPHIKAFSPRDFSLALGYLELPQSAGSRILHEAAEMDREIGPVGCLSLVNQLLTRIAS